jgi:hypothetical protein
VNFSRRPPLVTAVGVIGIVAGVVPLVEMVAVVVSAPFAAWFLALVHSILPVRVPVAVTLLIGIAVADIAFGAGVLARRRLGFYGMVVRSLIAIPIDYLNFTAGNRAGALVGLAVSLFVLWALLRSDSRRWFQPVDIAGVP